MTSKELKYGRIVSGNIFILKKLDLLCLNRRYLGFFMLVEILNILINENIENSYSFSRLLYPRVSEMFDKKPETIERNIRNLIDKCWSKQLAEKLNLCYEHKPKCLHFVYAVKANIIKDII